MRWFGASVPFREWPKISAIVSWNNCIQYA
jgi:hypothetical protein